MQLSISVRIAESADKRSISLPFDEFAALARESGYHAVCLRASAAGLHTPPDELAKIRKTLERNALKVSMVTSDFEVPLNSERGPAALRDIERHVALVKSLGADLLRVCMKQEEDIAWAQRAADVAAVHGVRLAHQCHTTSLFETVDSSLCTLERVNRPNFGVIYEPANLLLCGQPYGPDVLRRLKPWLLNVYVQNHRPGPHGKHEIETWLRGNVRFDPLPLWEPGGVDFQQVFAGLKDIGYDGYVTVHQAYAELMGPQDAAVKSAEYLRTLAPFDSP